MRTDVQIDKRKVYCPNVTFMGYNKCYAQFGDIVIFDLDRKNMIGRVIGRVHYATQFDKPNEPIRDWILVAALGDDLTFVMERWVNPKEVTKVFNLENFGGRDFVEFFSFFFGPQWKKEKSSELRNWVCSGWHTFKNYKANQNKNK